MLGPPRTAARSARSIPAWSGALFFVLGSGVLFLVMMDKDLGGQRAAQTEPLGDITSSGVVVHSAGVAGSSHAMTAAVPATGAGVSPGGAVTAGGTTPAALVVAAAPAMGKIPTPSATPPAKTSPPTSEKCKALRREVNVSSADIAGTEDELLLSPTFFRELSDGVYGWMAELKWWTGQGNNNEEFNADGHIKRDTNLDVAIKNGCMYPGVVIFVETYVMKKWFAEMHAKIPVPYVLVTGHSDKPCPGEFQNKLSDEKLLHWFGNNPTTQHDKFTPIPLGLNWFYHATAIHSIRKRGLHQKPKTKLSVANFYLASHARRSFAWGSLCKPSKQSWVDCISKGDWQYPAGAGLTPQLEAFLPYKYWFSPRGNGLDCHRTWEALYLGAVPVVESSNLDSLYKGLPVLIVNSFDDVTKELLESKYPTFTSNGELKFEQDKIHSKYWIELFEAQMKTDAKSS